MPIRISTVIRESRKAKGLTQEALAECVGVSSGYIGQIERGETMPSAMTLSELIEVLGIDANRLFYDDSEKMSISNEISIRASRLSRENQQIVLGLINVIEQTCRKGIKNEDSHL